MIVNRCFEANILEFVPKGGDNITLCHGNPPETGKRQDIHRVQLGINPGLYRRIKLTGAWAVTTGQLTYVEGPSSANQGFLA